MRTALLTALLIAPLALSAQTSDPAVRLSLNENGEYESGDNARVRVRTEQDGYLLVLRTDVEGWIRVLYPTDPYQDHFVRGGKEFEIRGRGDREAFQATSRGGSGVVLAAYSARPFDVAAFARNDHWDYRILDTLRSGSDPEAALLAIVDQMADSASVEYDVLTYTVAGNRSTRYASSSYYPSSYSYYSFGYHYDWYRPYYSSYYYDSWYRPYYRSYYSCYFCYSPGWYVGFSYGYRPWWGYRSNYYGYRSSYTFGNSSRSLTRLAFNQWNRGAAAGRELRNARTGAIAEQSRYTSDLADRRRREVIVTSPTVQATALRRTVSAPERTGAGQAATDMRRVTHEGGTETVARREFVPGNRSGIVRRETAADGSRTIRRVDVPERRAVEESRGSSGERREAPSRGNVSRPSYGGERTTPSRSGGESRPSSGGSRGGDGGGRRSPGASSAPSRGSSGGGDRSAPSGGGGGRRRVD